MSLSFPKIAELAWGVGQTPGQTPWSAADALVGLLGLNGVEFIGDRRVQGDPRRPGGLPHKDVQHG